MRKRLTSQLVIASLVLFVFLFGSFPIKAQSSVSSATTAIEKNTIRVLSDPEFKNPKCDLLQRRSKNSSNQIGDIDFGIPMLIPLVIP